jgi:hypothetical protein
MTDLSKFRDLFARFQNVNLLALMRDLEEGRVIRNSWVRDGRMCPISHGVCVVGEDDCLLVSSRGLGKRWLDIHGFTSEWDWDVRPTKDVGVLFDPDPNRVEALQALLQSIWDERLADADAVQQAIEKPVYGPSPLAAARKTFVEGKLIEDALWRHMASMARDQEKPVM